MVGVLETHRKLRYTLNESYYLVIQFEIINTNDNLNKLLSDNEVHHAMQSYYPWCFLCMDVNLS